MTERHVGVCFIICQYVSYAHTCIKLVDQCCKAHPPNKVFVTDHKAQKVSRSGGFCGTSAACI